MSFLKQVYTLAYQTIRAQSSSINVTIHGKSIYLTRQRLSP